jgi:drug/metabolite transporter (DMT)-like permease
MDAVLLSLCSAACYGAVAVALRSAVARDAAGGDLATLLTVLPAFAMVLAAAILRFDFDINGLWPFVVAGVLSPGISQTLFTLGVRDAGAARAAVSVGLRLSSRLRSHSSCLENRLSPASSPAQP